MSPMSDTEPNSSKSDTEDKKAEGSHSPSNEVSEGSLEEVSGGITMQRLVLAEGPDGKVFYKVQGESRPS